MIRFFRLPFLFRRLYPEALFRVKTPERVVYLSFDDGPDPGATPIILDILKAHEVKATFFCSGRAVKSNPLLFKRIADEGHHTGNHGYLHRKGWLTSDAEYLADVFEADNLIGSKVFRPPFGSLSIKQYSVLRRRFKIVFWDLIVYDFDSSFGAERVLDIISRKVRPGCVLVLHDTSKSCATIILDNVIVWLKAQDYKFSLIAEG
jgi:peptidoglycan-N-acetylglucosamine deacetylase